MRASASASRSASITACDFIDAKPCHIRVRSAVQDCAVVANRFSGGPKIVEELKRRGVKPYLVCAEGGGIILLEAGTALIFR